MGLLTTYRHPGAGRGHRGFGIKALAGAPVGLFDLDTRQHLGLKAQQLAAIRHGRDPAGREMATLPAVDGCACGGEGGDVGRHVYEHAKLMPYNFSIRLDCLRQVTSIFDRLRVLAPAPNLQPSLGGTIAWWGTKENHHAPIASASQEDTVTTSKYLHPAHQLGEPHWCQRQLQGPFVHTRLQYPKNCQFGFQNDAGGDAQRVR